MKIGDTNPAVDEHIRRTIAEANAKTGRDDMTHTVFVAVYVDGMLEFAGANASNIVPDRATARYQADNIIRRMNPNGDTCAMMRKADR